MGSEISEQLRIIHHFWGDCRPWGLISSEWAHSGGGPSMGFLWADGLRTKLKKTDDGWVSESPYGEVYIGKLDAEYWIRQIEEDYTQHHKAHRYDAPEYIRTLSPYGARNMFATVL